MGFSLLGLFSVNPVTLRPASNNFESPFPFVRLTFASMAAAWPSAPTGLPSSNMPLDACAHVSMFLWERYRPGREVD